MEDIQEEFAQTDERLGDDQGESPDLMACLTYASEENARAACMLVSQNVALTAGSHSLKAALSVAEQAQEDALQRADQDPLTSLFNRSGWDRRAKLTLRGTATRVRRHAGLGKARAPEQARDEEGLELHFFRPRSPSRKPRFLPESRRSPSWRAARCRTLIARGTSGR